MELRGAWFIKYLSDYSKLMLDPLLRILPQQNTALLSYVCQCVSQCVSHRRDISSFLHCARFWTIQTIYFLKAGDTHYPATHCPLTHHPHRPTNPSSTELRIGAPMYFDIIRSEVRDESDERTTYTLHLPGADRTEMGLRGEDGVLYISLNGQEKSLNIGKIDNR